MNPTEWYWVKSSQRLWDALRARRHRLVLSVSVLGALLLFGLVLFLLPTLVIKFDLGSKVSSLSAAELAEAKNNVRGTSLQAIGGLLLLTGAAATWRTIHVNQQGQVTERFTRAIDHLGNKGNVDVRLGGIYALERIARDSKQDHGPVMEILTAFVREYARWRPDDPEVDEQPRPSVPVQAALTVIGRRKYQNDPPATYPDVLEMGLPRNYGFIDLRGIDARRVDLSFAHLEGADLEGAHLENGSLYRAYLTGANLIGAYLQDAALNLASLERASLAETDLRGAHAPGARLERATLVNADLRGTSLYGAHLQGADLTGANLIGAHLGGAEADSETQWPQDFDPLPAGVTLL